MSFGTDELGVSSSLVHVKDWSGSVRDDTGSSQVIPGHTTTMNNRAN